MQTVFDAQSFQAAVQMLRDQRSRGFRIDIETESTILADQTEQQKSRMEMLQAVGAFLQSALPMIQAMPTMLPLVGKMVLFMLRSFNSGVELESAFEDAISKLEGNPASMPNPHAQQMQLKQQEMQGKLSLQQQKMQQDQQDHQMDLQGRQMEQQADATKASAEMRKAMLDEQMARMDHERSIQQMHTEAALAQTAPLAPQKLEFGAGVMTRGDKR